MNKYKQITLLGTFLILIICSNCFAIGDDTIDSIAIKAINQIHAEDFREAVNTFKSLIPLRPETPMPYFYIAASYLSLINEYRNPNYLGHFEVFIDSAVYFGEKSAEAESGTAEDYFYYGGALGYRGIHKSDIGDWWGAFKDGARARGKLVKAHELDSTNCDVYFGLGAYDYWRSAKTKVLWWLPFFADKREQGIEYTKIAINKGKYSSNEAKYALIRMYHEEKDFQTMLDLWYDSIEEINPDDPFALWWIGDGYAQMGQWEKSEAVYKHLLETILHSPYYHSNAEIEIRYNIALAQVNRNFTNEAIGNLREILQLEDEIVEYGAATDFLKLAKKLLKEVENRKR
ncbi:MAG: hypothetical protein GY855_03445 [candidate division Zixibacteria bacterium]|nr:hypothetical protein [candidate division Zixibacteria bacterium]